MTDRETIDVYQREAQNYARRFSKKGIDADQQAFLDMLPKAARVLDLGCGPGRSAGVFAKAGHSVLAVDATPAMVALAQTQDGVDAQEATFDDIPDLGQFDAIWANFSLLHAEPADLPRHIADCAAALNPGGIFHIGMKTGEGMQRDTIGRRYTYVSRDQLSALLASNGLQIERENTGADPGLDGTTSSWIVLQARKSG